MHRWWGLCVCVFCWMLDVIQFVWLVLYNVMMVSHTKGEAWKDNEVNGCCEIMMMLMCET